MRHAGTHKDKLDSSGPPPTRERPCVRAEMRVADHTVPKSTPLTTTNHNNIERRHWAAKGVLRGCELAKNFSQGKASPPKKPVYDVNVQNGTQRGPAVHRATWRHFPLPCSPCIFPYSNVGWQMEGSEEGMHLQGGAGKGRAQGAPGCGVSVEGMRSVDVPTRSRTGGCIGRNRSARAICRQYYRARVGNASTYFTPSPAATR